MNEGVAKTSELIVGAVSEEVNELESSDIPLLEKEGWLRHKSNVAKPPKRRRRGGRLAENVQASRFRQRDHPVCANEGSFAAFFDSRILPLLFKEGNKLSRQFIHSFIDRPYRRFFMFHQ
jgi:hypothetical protein